MQCVTTAPRSLVTTRYIEFENVLSQPVLLDGAHGHVLVWLGHLDNCPSAFGFVALDSDHDLGEWF